MRYYQIIEAMSNALPVWNPKQVDPALLTFKEWYNIVNPTEKHHPSSAYDVDVESLNRYDNKEKFTRLINRIKLAGLDLEIRLHSEPARYVKYDANNEIERIDGKIQYFTPEELKSLGKRPEEHTIGVFEGDTKIGAVQDEWGTVLVMVAREYRNIGLGTILQKLARTMEPAKSSGGFTPQGGAGFRRVHNEFVREALANGKYSSLVREKKITIDRVKEILQSAQLKKSKIDQRNLSINNPEDWLLYVGEYGDFVLYDKKIKELIVDGGEQNDYFIDRMILGAVNVREMESRNENWALITLFGGDTIKIKKFMLKLALSFAKNEGEELWADLEDISLVDSSFGKLIGDINLKTGFKRQQIELVGNAVPYKDIGAQEAQFRKSFDKYGEFKERIIELAYGKFK